MLVSWNCTNACNLSCSHCSRDAGQSAPRELSFQEGQRLIDGAAQAGFRLFIFSGGEALLRPRRFRSWCVTPPPGECVPCSVPTGHSSTSPLPGRFKKRRLARAGLSLDSVRPRAHDLFPGCRWRLGRHRGGLSPMCRPRPFLRCT